MGRGSNRGILCRTARGRQYGRGLNRGILCRTARGFVERPVGPLDKTESPGTGRKSRLRRCRRRGGREGSARPRSGRAWGDWDRGRGFVERPEGPVDKPSPWTPVVNHRDADVGGVGERRTAARPPSGVSTASLFSKPMGSHGEAGPWGPTLRTASFFFPHVQLVPLQRLPPFFLSALQGWKPYPYAIKHPTSYAAPSPCRAGSSIP